MCACEPGYVCARCARTPADPAWWDAADRDDEREQWDALTEDGDDAS